MPKPGFKFLLSMVGLWSVIVVCNAQDWVRMSGITDIFYEVKMLSGTDTLIVSTAVSGMYWTPDAGETWQILSTPPGGISSFEIYWRQGIAEIMGVTSGPRLCVSTNMGQSWSYSTILDYLYQQLMIDRYLGLWAHSENLIFHSDDYGAHWDTLFTSAEITNIQNLWISPQDSSKLWLAADEAGAYFSTDRGQSWTQSYSGGNVIDVEGNPQNPYSSIIVLYEDEMYWNHGNNVWTLIEFPVTGRFGDMVFLDNDSTQLLGIRGYYGSDTIDNIFRSSDGGSSWTLDEGSLCSAGGWRLQTLGYNSERIVVLLTGGALLANNVWNSFWRLNVGSLTGSLYEISRHQIGCIWGSSHGGIYISTDAGMSWLPTPDASGVFAWAEHTGRIALYTFCNWMVTDLALISFPSMQVEMRGTLPESAWWITCSEADTSLLYCLSWATNLYVSQNGGCDWVMVDYPGDPGEICLIHPSSTDSGFAFITNTIYLSNPYSRAWRTYDYGESWELVYLSSQGERIVEAWSGVDALTDFNFTVHSWENEWYYYTLNGGDSFDSLLTSHNSEGYVFWPWGDSVRVIPSNGADSIYITPDRGQTLEFRIHRPEGSNSRIYDGSYSQLVGMVMTNQNTYYHGPYTSVHPPKHDQWNPCDLSISIYPNPVNSVAFVSLSGIIITDPIQIRIYDILGRQAGAFRIKSSGQRTLSLPLPISNLASGTYFVTAENPLNQHVLVKKIVVLK